MACPTTKTVKQFMDAQGTVLGLNMECSKRPQVFSMVLKHIWSSIYMLPGIVKSVALDVDQTSITLSWGSRVYTIEGFYGKGCKACDCVEKLNDTCLGSTCGSCDVEEGCAHGYDRIKMVEMKAVPEIFKGQYNIPCVWSTEVTYSLPAGCTDAYMRYYECYPNITDENSSIGIPEYLEPALQAILKYYTVHNGGTEQGDEQRFKDDFNAFIKQQLEVFAPTQARDLIPRLAP